MPLGDCKRAAGTFAYIHSSPAASEKVKSPDLSIWAFYFGSPVRTSLEPMSAIINLMKEGIHQYKLVILLEDFQGSEEEPLSDFLELCYGWRLAKTSLLDLPDNIYQHFGGLISPFHRDKLSSTEFALTKEFELSADKINNFTNTEEYELAVAQSHWIGVALRILRPGNFVMHRIVLRKHDTDWSPVQSFLVRDKFYQPAGLEILDQLYVGSDEKNIISYSKYLVDLAINNENKHHRVLNALDLFNEALKQYRYDTKLILMVSAIESLFNFSKGQTTEKIAVGASRFIEPDSSKRLELYNEIKDLYTVRSGLIHGSKLERVRKQVFYNNVPLQKEIARLAYQVISKSIERIIDEDLANDFNDSKLLTLEYKKANLGLSSHIY